MAEMAVSYALRSISNKLIPLLSQQEENSWGGVHEIVLLIQDNLQKIQLWLKDAEARAYGHLLKDEEGEKSREQIELESWLQRLRKVAYNIEDVIDENIVSLAKHRTPGVLDKVAYFIIKQAAQHKMASQFGVIKRSIDDIREEGEKFSFSSSVSGGSSSSTKYSRLEEDKIVGMESHRDELIKMLVARVLELTVISLVGEHGIGKTTLAKIVYDHPIVVGHFDCRTWIADTTSFSNENLIRRMIKQLCKARKEDPPEGLERMELNSLIDTLRDYLSGKKYVVVFEDVWSIDFWGCIKSGLPNKNKGSRIIVTTTSQEVSLSFKRNFSFNHVLELKPLAQEKAWELFCMKAFRYAVGGHCPAELEKLCSGIVARCKGLPLAITAIGGFLSTKNEVSEWQEICQSLVFDDLQLQPHLLVRKFVFLNYHDLPCYLKSCLVNLAMVPLGYSILCERLIKIWIAEEFIEGQEGKTLEEVAKEYLIELIHRSLVQVSQVDFEGRVVSIRADDLARMVILSKLRELGQGSESNYKDFNGLTRRVSIIKLTYIDKNISVHPDARIRSVYLFEKDSPLPMALLGASGSSFKLLKVLDLQDALLDNLPKEVGDLFHLRYLSVRNTKVEILPKSIGKLHNLQTLDLSESCVYDLPVEINKLCKLRHLLAYHYNTRVDLGFDSIRGVKIQNGLGHLNELQSLYYVEANCDRAGLIEDLKMLRQLRKLGIKKVTSENGRALSRSIEEMEHLESLEVSTISRDEMLDLESISSPHPSLQRLYLSGRLERLPNWIPKLHNLVRLRLFWSGFTNDPLKTLQALPNLLWLGLYQVYEGEQLYFEAGGFQKLKLLLLRAFNRLNMVIMDKGALPVLERLIIGPCPQLKEVPFGILHLRKLTTLEFYGMPKEFEDRIVPYEGQDKWIVEHIPAVRVHKAA